MAGTERPHDEIHKLDKEFTGDTVTVVLQERIDTRR